MRRICRIYIYVGLVGESKVEGSMAELRALKQITIELLNKYTGRIEKVRCEGTGFVPISLALLAKIRTFGLPTISLNQAFGLAFLTSLMFKSSSSSSK